MLNTTYDKCPVCEYSNVDHQPGIEAVQERLREVNGLPVYVNIGLRFTCIRCGGQWAETVESMRAMRKGK